MNQNELREYLFQKDLVQEKEMDKLIKDAQPKKVNEDYKLKLYKPPIITRDLIGPEYTAEQQLMDLSLDLQLQNMVKLANYAVSDKKPEAMKSSVTEEMIAEYKKEVMKPVEIGGKYRLYRPVEIPPPLKKPDPIPYDHKGAYITEAEAQRKAGKIINDINNFEAELDRLNNLKGILEDQFKLDSTAFDEALIRDALDKLLNLALEEIIKDKGLPMPKPKNKPNLIKTIIDAEKGALGKIKTDLGKVEGDTRVTICRIVSSPRSLFQKWAPDFLNKY